MEAVVSNKISSEGILFSKKVILMPINRPGAMITDKKHIGYFGYDGTKSEFFVPLNKRGGIATILSKHEQEFFEQELRDDLNFTKKADNFWWKFKTTVIIDSNFKEKGMEFDLSNVEDNLRWRILKVQPMVAPSWEDRYESGEYRFALCDAGFEEAHRATKADKMKKAYKLVNKIDSSVEKMYNFLSVYWMQMPKSKRPDQGATREAYSAMIQELIDVDVDKFIEVADDPNYETKLFIQRAMVAGFIDKTGFKGDYTIDGRFLGRTIEDAIRNILSPEFNEDYIRIRGMLNSSRTSSLNNKSNPPAQPMIEDKPTG